MCMNLRIGFWRQTNLPERLGMMESCCLAAILACSLFEQSRAALPHISTNRCASMPLHPFSAEFQVVCNKFVRIRALCVFLCALFSVASLSAATLLSTVPVGQNPGQIVANPAAHLIYIVNQGSNTVTVLDSESLTVKKVITVAAGPSAIAVDPPANVIYVASTSGTITAISGTQVVLSGRVGGVPAGLVVDSVLKQLYVMDTARNQIEVFNTTTGALLATLHTSLTPAAMALNIATHSLFVACTGGSGSVVVIDGNHNQILTTVPVAAGNKVEAVALKDISRTCGELTRACMA